ETLRSTMTNATTNGGTSASASTANDNKAVGEMDSTRTTTTTTNRVSPKSKFQAAAFVVGGAAKAKKDKLNKLQTITATAVAQDNKEKKTIKTAAKTSNGGGGGGGGVGGGAAVDLATLSTKVSPKSKFQAAAFALKSSNANKAVAVPVAAPAPATRTTSSKLKSKSKYDVDNPLVSVSAAFTNARTGENAVSPKTKLQTAAFAVKNSNNANKATTATIAAAAAAAATIGTGTTTTTGNNNGEDNNDTDAIDNWAKLAYAAKITALAAKNARVTQQEKLFNRCVVQATTWDVWSPPPINSVSGKVIPRLLNKHSNRRRVSLEIHRVTPILLDAAANNGNGGGDGKDDNNNKKPGEQKTAHSYHESVLRILDPASRELSRQYKIEAIKKIHSKAGSSSSSDSLRQINEAIRDHDENNDIDDDGSVSSSNTSIDENSRYYELADHGGKEYDGWKSKYSIPMYGIYIRGHKKKTVNILISFNDFKQEREIIFDTIDDTKLFIKEIDKQKRLENTRQDERLQSALGDEIKLPKFETITLLFEIVSAYDIPIGDYTTSDPYVIAYMGHQEIHRTKNLSKTLNPIWTLKTGSLFLLTVESKRFFIEDGMKFVIKDHDKLGQHDVLGVVNLGPKILYNSTGQRIENKLQPPPNSKLKDVPGILVIRCRRASQYDQKFMIDYEKKGEGMKGVSGYNAPTANTNVFKTITTRVKKRDRETDVLYVRLLFIIICVLFFCFCFSVWYFGRCGTVPPFIYLVCVCVPTPYSALYFSLTQTSRFCFSLLFLSLYHSMHSKPTR
ncbi:MAG: hypothetical protein ACI8RD_014082, partial [Bacillariaceae sp.]